MRRSWLWLRRCGTLTFAALIALSLHAQVHGAAAVDLSVTPAPQRLQQPANGDTGAYDCLPASIFMVLRYLQQNGRISGQTIGYEQVRSDFRAGQPPNGDLSWYPAPAIVDALTSHTVAATINYAPSPGWQDWLSATLQTQGPVVANIANWLLLSPPGHPTAEAGYSDREGHAIVISGIHDGQVFYDDPWDGQRWGLPEDLFAKAWGGTWGAITFASAGAQAPPAAPAVPTATQGQPPPPAATSPSGKLGLRTEQGDVVILDLATAKQTAISPPEPGVHAYALSADLSTYAWVSGQIWRPESASFGRADPSAAWALNVKHLGQPTRTIMTSSQLFSASGISSNGTSAFIPAVALSLNADGSVVAVGPLGAGVDGWEGGTLVIDTQAGTVRGKQCDPAPGATLSPDGLLLAGGDDVRSGHLSPGVSESLIAICAPSSSSAQAAQTLQAAIDRDHADDTSAGDTAYWLKGSPSWSSDARSIAFVETRTHRASSAGKPSSVDSVKLLSATAIKDLHDQPTQTVGGIELANAALSADASTIAFEEDDFGTSGTTATKSIWLVNADGSGLRRIADGGSPFWVSGAVAPVNLSATQQAPVQQTAVLPTSPPDPAPTATHADYDGVCLVVSIGNEHPNNPDCAKPGQNVAGQGANHMDGESYSFNIGEPTQTSLTSGTFRLTRSVDGSPPEVLYSGTATTSVTGVIGPPHGNVTLVAEIVAPSGAVLSSATDSFTTFSPNGPFQTPQMVNGWPQLEIGTQGESVWALQYLLQAHGLGVTIDGQFGLQTDNSLATFEKSQPVQGSTVVRPAIWQRLLMTVQQGSNGPAVMAAQRLLAAHGSSVTVDGNFGSQTDAVVRAFQRSRGLTVDGQVGPQTWQALLAGQ